MLNHRSRLLLTGVILSLSAPQFSSAKEKVIRAGIIGCDTSHVIAFTNLINDPKATGPFADVEVTVAFPGGSPDIPDSKNRLDGYVKQLRDKGITIVDSLDALIDQCDAVLLESVDGRPHLQQFRAVAKGKPVFVDKPAAASLADLLTIYRVADETHTPTFSSSSLRFCKEVQEIAADKSIGDLLGCETAGPMSTQAGHPDLFWYGIHGVEPLFTIMGTGCQTVSRTDSPLSTVVVAKWKDGRLGSYRGLKKGHSYALTAFGSKGVAQRTGFSGYEPAVIEICKFFATGKPPVSREDTLEIYAFMEAADESKHLGGKPVAMSEIMQRAQQQSAGKTSSASKGN